MKRCAGGILLTIYIGLIAGDVLASPKQRHMPVSIDFYRAAAQNVDDELTRLIALRNHLAKSESVDVAIKTFLKSIKEVDTQNLPLFYIDTYRNFVDAWQSFSVQWHGQINYKGEWYQFEQLARDSEPLIANRFEQIDQSFKNLKTAFDLVHSESATQPFLFSSNRSGQSKIYQSQLFQEPPIVLEIAAQGVNWPSLSRDGQKLLFQSKRENKFDIGLYFTHTKQTQWLTDHSDHDYLPAFGRDESWVYFTSWRSNEREERVNASQSKARFFRYHLETKQIEQWSEITPGNSTGVVWLKSENLAITTIKRGDYSQLYLIDNQGKLIDKLTDIPAYNAGASISPSGRQVAFYSSNDVVSQIGTLDMAEPKSYQWLVQDGFNWSPEWSEDGKWLTFSRSMDPQHKVLDIFIISVTNPSYLIPVIKSPARDSEFRWLPQPKLDNERDKN